MGREVHTRIRCALGVGLCILTLGVAAGEPPPPASPYCPVPLSPPTPPTAFVAPPSGGGACAPPEGGTTNRATLGAPVSIEGEPLPIDLPTALRLGNASNPTIAVAQVRVQQAYYRQRQAEFLWLPTLQAGTTYYRHDGLIQSSRGDVFSVARWSGFVGGGAVMRFEVSDALFGPLITRRLTDAQAAAAQAVTNDVQLDVAETYLDLLEVHGRLAINFETLDKAREMQRGAEAAQAAKMGKTPADLPRALTEVNLRLVERAELEARAGAVSARLAQLLLLRPSVDLVPADPAILPIAVVPLNRPLDELIALGLANRPEVAQARAVIDATRSRWRQAQFDPLLPRLEVGYTAGQFGGGRSDHTIDAGGRGDGLAQAIWELRNLGAGDIARARERRALFNEATLHLTEIQARVGAEVVAAARAALARERSLSAAQEAVRQALVTWQRLREAGFGMAGPDRRYDPLEPLIAEQQLAVARTQYLAEVIGYNKAQFRLYTALGSPPLSALPQATPLPVEVPVTPSLPELLPRPRPDEGKK